MRVGIIGSRDYPDLDQVERFVYALARKYPETLVISGGARGVDSQAEETAREMRLKVRSYRPKRRRGGYEILVHETGRFVVVYQNDEGRPHRESTFRAAAFFRNGLIVNDSLQIVAFQHQHSYGTQDGIDKARAVGVPVTVYTPEL